MSFASVIGIALVVGVVAVVGIAIISYMSSLVRNAYEIKVEMRKDLDEGIKQVKAETIKQTKAARAELSSELERSRTGLIEDLKARQAATDAALAEELKKRDTAWQEENENLLSIIQELRDQIEESEGRPSLHSRTKKLSAAKEVVEKTSAENSASPDAVPSAEAPAQTTAAPATQTAAKSLKLASF